jgi:hypothetical protein
MIFRTKRELLRYRGKNENDNKLVDRRIASGKVVKVADGYKVVDLEDEVKKLRSELENAKSVANTTQEDASQGKNTLLDSELLSHLEYLYIQNEKKNGVIKEIINMIYLKHQDKGWDYAVEIMSKQFGYEADASEEDELAFIKDLLSKHK